jgi:hypothetical protein
VYNTPAGYVAKIADWQQNGVSRSWIANNGTFFVGAETTTEVSALRIAYQSGGSTGSSLQAGGITVGPNAAYRFGTANGIGTVDAAFRRRAAGQVEVNSGIPGELRDFFARNASFSGPLTSGIYTFATRPIASSFPGASIVLSDRNNRSAKSNGTDWVWADNESTIAS